jgi:hypothetical protein
MPCVAQPLVAAAWLLPVNGPAPGASGGWLYGVDTTSYTDPRTSPGPGYVFSGGVPDLSSATTVPCDGQLTNFSLPAGGSVVITWTTSTGGTASSASGPIDNLYLPGLGSQAALVTVPLSGDEQVITGLGAGVLRIDEVNASFTCTGTATGYGAEVIVTAGQTTDVTCTVTGA